MSESKYFKENLHAFGTAKPNDVVKFEFDFKPGTFPIQYIDPGCRSCTKAKFDRKRNKVVGTIDMKAFRANWDKGNNQVNTYIYVYMDDGRDARKGDDDLVMMDNPEKEKEALQVAGLVVNE